MKNLITSLSIFAICNVFAQTYQQVTGTVFIDGFNPAMQFFDMDNDNDLDVMIIANSNSVVGNMYAKLYSNDGLGVYTEVSGPFEAVARGDIAVGDIDNDGDSDMVIIGKNVAGNTSTKVYLNNGSGSFSIMANTNLPNVFGGEVRLADLDSDNDLDLVIGGLENTSSPLNRMTKLFFNNGSGVFTESTTSTFDELNREILVHDFDLDGDQDILLSGYFTSGGQATKLYLNNGSGVFTVSTTNINHTGDIALINHNNDNYMDIIIAGHLSSSQSTAETQLYTNNGSGNFVLVTGNSFPSFSNAGEMIVYDFDGDNDEDVILVGGGSSPLYENHAKMFHNNGSGSFTENTNAGFIGAKNSNIAMADIDSDGDKEILILGIGPGAAILYEKSTCTVNIPDANFKSYLVGNSAINTNGDTEIQCIEASAFTGSINCSSQSISNLIGIEAFINLSSLTCSGNNLTQIDLSLNTALTHLQCDYNNLVEIDVSQNTLLTYLRCFNNQIDSIDISLNTQIVNFGCENNNLNYLTVANGNNSNFIYFRADQNSNLTCIQVDDVAYSTTNWTNIDATSSFSNNCNSSPCTVNIPDANFKAYLVGDAAINTNGDTEIQCSEASAFTGQINCGTMGIQDITGLEAFTALTDLRCHSNSLTALDVSNNTALTILGCANNNISLLDLTNNTNLTILNCSNNIITSLDVSHIAGLNSLKFYNNQLTSLNVANSNNTNFSTFEGFNNPNLTCIQVDDATYSTSNWTDIDATTSFNENCQMAVSIEQDIKENLRFYPNPTKGLISFNTEQQINTIEIYNLRGQRIAHFNNVKTVDVSNLPKGIYTVKIIIGSSMPVIERLIKN